MTAPADFRQYALDCMREAECADNDVMRLTMLGLARIWMEAALETDQSVMRANEDLARKDGATIQSTPIARRSEEDDPANSGASLNLPEHDQHRESEDG
jgi:hypothetical protein